MPPSPQPGDSPYLPRESKSSSEDDGEFGELTEEDLLGMAEVDRIKWQKKKEKQVQRESEKEKHKKKKKKQTAPGNPAEDPEKPQDHQTPPQTPKKRPLGNWGRKSGGLPPTPPEGGNGEGPPRVSPAAGNTGGQNANSGQQNSSNTSGPIKSPRGKVKDLIQIIYKGEIPFPIPSPFNPATSKRRRRKDDDGSDAAAPPKKAKTDDPHHDTRIDGIDFKTWNTSWLMRLSQLKGLPTHPPPEAPTPAALCIQLIDQLEDQEHAESAASRAYGGTTRSREDPIPLVNSRGDVFFSVTADLNLATFNSLEAHIRKVLARRGIVLAAGDLRIYATASEPYEQGKMRHLSDTTRKRREAVLSTHLEGVWRTVYAWRYGRELRKEEEEKRRRKKEEKAKGQKGGDGKEGGEGQKGGEGQEGGEGNKN